MKYIISESRLKEIIGEQVNLKNQEMVDKILDKVSKNGMQSLSAKELSFLKNPDDSESFLSSDSEDLDGVEYVMDALINMGLVEEQDITIEYEDDKYFIEIDNLKSEEFDFFFECDGVLRIDVDHDSALDIYNVDLGAWGSDECLDEKIEVYDYFSDSAIRKILDGKKILLWINDSDNEISDSYN